MQLPKISVIMPVFLGEYPLSAPNRKQQFVRAVDSFLRQDYPNKQLVVASDGCPDSIAILNRNYKLELKNGTILLLELPRHELFTGEVRQQAIEAADGHILCNLDHDDYFQQGHLLAIGLNFGSADWAYFNHYVEPNFLAVAKRTLSICDGTLDKMCNASYAWRRDLSVSWSGCNGRQDNKAFIPQLLQYKNNKKIYGTGYVVTNVQVAGVVQRH